MTTIDSSIIQRAAKFGAATIHEAMGKKGALPYGIKPLAANMKLCGPVVTVSSPPGDNLMLHQALYVAPTGSIMVVEVSGGYEYGYWGEIMTIAAQERKIAGLVIDGCVRDADLIEKFGFPVFARGLSIRGTGKDAGGSIDTPIVIGDVTIHPGDLIVGDRDGLVVIAAADIQSALEASQKREDKEDQIMKDLRAAKTTLEIYGWPRYAR